MDKAILDSYIKESPLVNGVDQEIASVAGVRVVQATAAEKCLRRIRAAGLDTVPEIEGALQANRQDVVALAKHGIRGKVPQGISIFYLAYVYAANHGGVDGVQAVLEASDVSEWWVEPEAEGIVAAYESLKHS